MTVYRVTNPHNSDRVFYDKRGRAVVVPPGKSVSADIADRLADMLARSGLDVEGGSTGSNAHDLLDRSGEMSAADFKAAVSAMTGKDYPSKRAAAEDLESLVNGGQ